ncbi:MAG: c-type cytochrome [Rudaea sp.]|uniref:c-type cytochrome n=1 Tax=unclassified Rudaea TaxID=2627037 RepID=UPI0010F6642D|nr:MULTISPECIES: c-type cytochrome [unclassified Rudaea]MBN8887807.1 c-type cytochrome [Rudaea sp.]MBR0346190.1 c-type cytochrome [Rudaea sp.]
MKFKTPLLLAAMAATAGLSMVATATETAASSQVQRGRYLVRVTGCNDCHTPGYAQSGGQTDEKLWLTGDALGWKGPWGTTYATNLRLFLDKLSEPQWLAHARTMQPRQPMPWYSMRAMSDEDLRAIYAFVKTLGPAGVAAPAYVPPSKPVQGPVVQFP